MYYNGNNSWSVDDYSKMTPYTDYGLKKMKEKVHKIINDSNLSSEDKFTILRFFDIITKRDN